MKIKTTSKEQQLQALKLFHAFGWSNTMNQEPETYEEFQRYPIIDAMDIKNKRYTISGGYSANSDTEYLEDLPKIISYLTESNIVIDVVLNSSYTASVSKDGIVVRCQTFPLSIAQSLLDAVEKVQEQ